LDEVFIPYIFDAKILRYFLPAWPLFWVNYDGELQELVGLLRRSVLVKSEGLLIAEQFLGLYLSVHLCCRYRIVGVGTIDHLEEDDSERPDVSLI
jgi:hypothetical protein